MSEGGEKDKKKKEEEKRKPLHNVKAMSRQFDVNIDFAVGDCVAVCLCYCLNPGHHLD